MKKIILLVALMVAVAGMTAQAATKKKATAKKAATTTATTEAAPAVDIKALQDTLSKHFGELNGHGVANYLIQTPDAMDSDFIRAFETVLLADTSNVAYMTGLSVGMNMLSQIVRMKSEQKVQMDRNVIAEAVKSSLGAFYQPSSQELQKRGSDFTKEVEKVSMLVRENDPVAIANKKAGEEYIAAQLKADKKLKRTESGLVYKIVQAGKGENFKDGDDVRMFYKGSLVDGTVFDQSKDTVSLGVNQVVKGFGEALKLMNPGSKILAIIPGNLAYGLHGAGDKIGPNATLVFEIEAFGVKEKAEMPKGNPGTVAPADRAKRVGSISRSDQFNKETAKRAPGAK